MSGAVEKLVERISAYGIINHLIPGTVFIVLVERFTPFSITADNMFASIIIYYFAGVVIGRFGSLCIEERMKNSRHWFRTDTIPHEKYTRAEMIDKEKKITTLSAVNNMFRSFISMFCCFLIVYLFSLIWIVLPECDFKKPITVVVGSIVLIILFAKSYQKQTGYVVSRANTVLRMKENHEIESSDNN